MLRSIDAKVLLCLTTFHSFAKRLGTIRTSLLVGCSVWALSIFLYAPALWVILTNTEPSRLDDFLAMCANPLERNLYEPILAYRITTPLLAWILHLHGVGAISIQYIALILTFVILFIVMQRRTDSNAAMLTCLALGLTHIAQWTNTHPGFPDSVTHLAAAVALMSSNTWLMAGTTILGMLNDERFILATPFILLWHIGPIKLSTGYQKLVRPVIGLLSGLLVVLSIRHALTIGWIGEGIPKLEVHFGIGRSLFNLHPHAGWPVFFPNVFLGFRWVWFIPCLVLMKCWRNCPRWFLMALVGGIVVATLSTMVVADISRSIGFFFPAIAISVWLLFQQHPSTCHNVLAIAAIFCFLTPGFYFGGADIQLYRPLPLVLIRTFTGWDVLDLFR